jgi:hypothetical protein
MTDTEKLDKIRALLATWKAQVANIKWDRYPEGVGLGTKEDFDPGDWSGGNCDDCYELGRSHESLDWAASLSDTFTSILDG